MKHILFFEPKCKGHQSEFIHHICQYIIKNHISLKYTFAVHPEFLVRFEAIATDITNRSENCIFFIPIKSSEYDQCNHPILSIRAIKLWNCMMSYLKRTGADHGIFMHIDLLQLPLTLRFTTPANTTLSGILFSPSVHYQSLSNSLPDLKEKAKTLRKNFFYKHMLRHKSLKTVFSLDPYFQDYSLQNYQNGSKVIHLTDPVPETNPFFLYPSDLPEILKPGMQSNKRYRFLLFGALSRRKGIFETLNALQFVDTDFLPNIEIIFAGKLEKKSEKRFIDLTNSLSKKFKTARITLYNRYVPEKKLMRLIQQADIILAPYQNFVGSSGMLLRAAQAKKPVLTQSYGLLGFYTKKYRLGMTVDTSSPKCIAKALTICIKKKCQNIANIEKQTAFIEGRTANHFAKTIIQNILDLPGTSKK